MPYVFHSDGYPEADEFSNNYQWIEDKSPNLAPLAPRPHTGPGIVQARPRRDWTNSAATIDREQARPYARERHYSVLVLLKRFLEWLPNSTTPRGVGGSPAHP